MFESEHVRAAQAQPRRGGAGRRWSALLSGLAFGVAGTLFFSSVASAAGLDSYPTEPTEAEASIAAMTLGGNDIIGLAESHAGSVSNVGPNREAFSGSLGGTEIVDFGAGYTIPLDQLLEFGQAGALLSESTATDGRNGEAISGIAGADGGLTLDGANGDFGTASIDLLSLFEKAGVDGATDLVVDQADFSFGLGGAWVEAIDGAFKDPDGVGGMGQYRVGDAKIELHSPVIEQAADGLSDAAGSLEQSLNETVNTALGLGKLLPGMTVDASVQTTLQQDVLDAVMLAPISTDDGLATIDLSAGTITVDVGRIGGNDDGVIPGRPVGLNNQNPNTELIDSDTYPFIASSVHDVIDKVLEVGTDAAVESLQAMTIKVAISALDGTSAGWDMDLTGNVTNDFCNPGGLTGTAACLAINGVKATMGTVTAPLRDIIANRDNPLYDVFTTVKTDMITVPIRAVVDPFLEIIAQNLFSVQINHQETSVCTPAGGGADVPAGLEVSALSFGAAGGTARLGFGNAGLRVDACNLAAVDPVLTATSPVPAGGETTVTSSGWTPGAEVSLQLTDGSGAPVGDPVVVTADADGNVPADTKVPVPADVTAGDFTVVGTSGDDEASGTLTVYAPSLEVESPVLPGDCAVVTSGGWLPNTQVTLQLTDASGAPVGDPVVVTTDADGNVPAGTCVEVPVGTEPGEHTVVGTDETGGETSGPVTVGDENGTVDPVLTATSPVPAGGETTVTSSGWTPASEVSLQLTAPLGNAVGDPVVVTTDADGNVPADTKVPVPGDSTAGLYTVVGSDADGNEASDTVQVYAPSLEVESPVLSGDCAVVTSGGWLPNTQVTLQLTDASGAPVGDPVVVTTDADGNVPAGTCVEVPVGTEPGEHTVVGTDETGGETSGPVTVGDENGTVDPVLTATSPVPAGGETTVTSSGWTPGAEVSLQLEDPKGEAAGDPVVVTTDAEGNVPADTQVLVPADATGGDYTVVGSDAADNEASASVTVYAPSISATSPVPAGGTTTVTSAGWLADSAVKLQLTNEAGDPVGDAVSVTTDAEGNVPAATTLPVPADATPGAHTVVGSDENGARVSTEIEVTVAGDAPVLTATSPVPAGGSTVVTSTGWDASIEVSLQLEDPKGEAAGDPVVVTTDAEGNVPADTRVLVPADATAGDYTVVGSDAADNEASASVAVYAPSISAKSPVKAGGTSAVTSEGWLPSSEVELQLVAGGNDLGDAVTVKTDAEGNVPADTTVMIPADTKPGVVAVHGTDANGVDVSAEITVVAADGPVCSNPAVTVSPSTASAGDTVTVTGTGFAAGTTATVQIFDKNGRGLLDPPVSVTVGDDCGFTVKLKVPGNTGPGNYTVEVTDGDGNTAKDTLTIRHSLAVTGTELGLYAPLAVLLLAAGATTIIVSRRARQLAQRNNQ